MYRQKVACPISILIVLQLLIVSNSLWSHELHNARLLCPSTSPRVCSNSCALSQWYIQPFHPWSPPLLLPSIFPSIRVFSKESTNNVIQYYLRHAREWGRETGRKGRREGGKEEGRKTFPSLPCNRTGSDQLDISTYHWVGASRNALQWELTCLYHFSLLFLTFYCWECAQYGWHFATILRTCGWQAYLITVKKEGRRIRVPNDIIELPYWWLAFTFLLNFRPLFWSFCYYYR